MSPIVDHILKTSGLDRTQDEPHGNHGDRLLFLFCLGIALGWLVGASLPAQCSKSRRAAAR